MKQLTALVFLFSFFVLAPLSPIKAAAEEVVCEPLAGGEDFTCRPNECKPCNKTNRKEADCATTTTAKLDVSFAKGEAECVQKDWDGKMTINAKDVTIPFVGYKKPDGKPTQDGKTLDDYSRFEQLYLADYFEGTSEYYQQYANYWLDWVNHAGIFRKLSPMAYQDKLKEQMATRAKESIDKAAKNDKTLQEARIHDYKINYVGRLCWDTPFPTDLFIAVINKFGLNSGNSIIGQVIKEITDRNHYCMFEGKATDDPVTQKAKETAVETLRGIFKQFNSMVPSFLQVKVTRTYGEVARLSDLINHFPPLPSEKDYDKKYKAWQTLDRQKDEKVGKWYKLWQATMMFSREDTPGDILPRMGTKNVPDDPSKNDKSKEAEIPEKDRIEKVPHVARLFEASKQVASMILPFGAIGEETKARAIPTVAPRPPANSCGQEGAIPIPECDQNAITDQNPNDTICCTPVEVPFSAVDIIENQAGYAECQAALANDDPADDSVCDESVSKTLERKFAVFLEHPYLKDIWDQTANSLVSEDKDLKLATAGAFNAFKPYDIEEFPDLEAKSKDLVKYDYDKGNEDPSTGQFFFNHLGGIQLGKEWVLKALIPFKE